ncbi:MAG TPA: hypothetical protein VFE37_30715 [Chloroflexota bacterium]|nr:hypothetical protein [Chloroflexota bacterium]
MRVAASLRVARVGGRAGALSWPLLAVLAGLLVWFGPWLAAREPQMGGDVTLEFYPRLAYAVAAIRHGALPLWSPWTMAGTPLLANPQLGVLYPGHWPLLALLPVGMALNYAVALHLVLAAGATYALGRRWALTPGAAALAAMSYALNGMFAARLWAGNLSLLEVMAWAPAMLYAAERFRADPGPRTWLLLVGVLALSLLVGFYHPWLLALLALGLYLLGMPGSVGARMRRLAALGAAVAVAAALAAPALLPAVELIRWTTRSGRLAWEFATAASLPPWHIVTLLLPELFGSGAGTYWPGPWWHWQELTAYAGVLPLVLAALACARPREPWVRYCMALGAIALVLALGRFTPVYGWFYDWVPGYGSLRDPGRHLLLFSLAVALLAGRGADRLLSGHGRRGVLGLLGAIFALAAVASVAAAQLADRAADTMVPLLSQLGLWAPRADLLAEPPTQLGATVLLLVARACGMAVVATAAALVATVLVRRVAPRWRPLLLLGAVFLDLSLFGWRYLHEPLPIAPGVPTGDPTAQYTDFLGAANVRQLQQVALPLRVAPLGREASLAGNAGYLLGVPLAIGLDPLLPRRYAELVAQMNGEPLAAFENLVVYLADRSSRLWPLLAARYRLVPQEPPPATGPPRFQLEEDPSALPRVFAAPTVRVAAGPEASLAAVAAPAFDPAREAVLEMAPGDAPAAARDPAVAAPPRAELERYASGAVDVRADLPAGGAVVLLDAWHPGWTATVAGRAVPVYPADHAFLGVALPPGSYEVQFRFDPGSWRAGLVLAAATLLVLAASAAALRWRWA